MKQISVILALVCLTLAGMCRAEGSVFETASTPVSWSDVLGAWPPKHWIEVGGGYGWSSAAKSQMLYSSATQFDVLFGQQYGQYNQLSNSSEQGALINVDLYITDKIWLDLNYAFGSQEQDWKWTEQYSVPTNWSGKTTFYTSPVISLNYAPFNIYGIKPYIGVGVEHVSATSDYTLITNGVNYLDGPGNPVTVDNGGWNILFRAGIRFPIWDRLTGSVDWEGGRGVSADTPVGYVTDVTTGSNITHEDHYSETIHTTALNASQFSASLHLALF